MLGILDKNEINEVLRNNLLGRIGCRDGNDIYVVPVTYIFQDDHILCHSFEGRKIGMMRKTPEVGFEVEDITDHRHWKCVIARGHYEEITDPVQMAQARALLSEKSLKRKASLSALPPAEAAPNALPASHGPSVFYRIRLFNLSGRYEHATT